MYGKCLVAEFNNRDELLTALRVLEMAGFTDGEVSTITRSEDVSDSSIPDSSPHMGSSPPNEKSVAASTLAGGALGAILGTTTMLGPFMIAGPILGMAAGAAGGGALTAAAEIGINREVGTDYEQRVRDGSLLLIVTGTSAQVDEAEKSLKTCGPKSLERFSAS
ncbi:MAG: DUF1269 domain-containing protein [Pirellulaceae bacterium]